MGNTEFDKIFGYDLFQFAQVNWGYVKMEIIPNETCTFKRLIIPAKQNGQDDEIPPTKRHKRGSK